MLIDHDFKVALDGSLLLSNLKEIFFRHLITAVMLTLSNGTGSKMGTKMLNLVLYLSLAFFKSVNCYEHDLLSKIPSFLGAFGSLQRELPIQLKNTSELKINLMKNLSKQNIRIRFVDSISKEKEFRHMIIIDPGESDWKNPIAIMSRFIFSLQMET